MLAKKSGKKGNYIIQPARVWVAGLPILGFENEEELNLYTIWHDALVDKRRESRAESEREKQIIRNEISRKSRLLTGSTKPVKSPPAVTKANLTTNSSSTTKSASSTTATPAVASRKALLPRPNQSLAAQSAASHQRQGSSSLPSGLTILNSVHLNTSSSSKQLMKYKLTKLYNKYRGRQIRRNFVLEKQRNSKIESEISKSYLNSWLAYTALQALRPPESNQNHIRINPQQVADYKQKSHLLPSSATSKKSSAASYDVYEIMEVLANTNKTNVTITRNANRAGTTGSIYSHSVNANTPGIVSTQLHLQARSYLDSMAKFYAEERQRLEEQKEEPSDEEIISRYIKI